MDLPIPVLWIPGGRDGQKGIKAHIRMDCNWMNREHPYCCPSLLESLLLQILSLHIQNQQTTKITQQSGMRQSLLLLQEKQKNN